MCSTTILVLVDAMVLVTDAMVAQNMLRMYDVK